MGGFLRACGSDLVDEDGRAIRLRGVGIGNWLLPEGYMWRLPAPVDRPRRIERFIAELIGHDEADRFWTRFRDRFIDEEDVADIATAGFNSLRLPLNARLLLSGNNRIDPDGCVQLDESEMVRVDRLVQWCRTTGVYVILDLHGAPGGQTGTNIDDSENDQPELFQYGTNADLTVALWKTLAARYADEWIVAGYDLLNEPLPEWFSQYNDRVLPLYRRITDAIRSVDRRHTIILEGAHWATDWSIFTERIDENLVLEFHKYWNNPDRESLTPYLAMRESWRVPIFMGEGGENNTDWYAGAFGLFDDLGISWNFWTWKKMDTTNSPLSIRPPSGWSQIVRAAAGEAKVPRDQAIDVFGEYAQNVASSRCDRRPEVTNALFRRVPVRVPGIFYVNADRGIGFDTPTPVLSGQTPHFRAGDRLPMAYVHRDGAPTLCDLAPRFQHGGGESWLPEEWIGVRLDEDAWVSYALEIPTDGVHRVEVWYKADEPACLRIATDEPTGAILIGVDSDGDTCAAEMALTQGMRHVTVRCSEGRVFLLAITVGDGPAGV